MLRCKTGSAEPRQRRGSGRGRQWHRAGGAESSAGRHRRAERGSFAILKRPSRWSLARSRLNPAPPVLGLLATLAVALGLASTNPGRARFEEFAAEQLSEVIIRELCLQGNLSVLMRLVLPNCAAMVRQQQPVLGQLAWAQTRRLNLGLFSLFFTELGGQQLTPNLRLPVYSAISVGAAGQMLLLTSSTGPAAAGQP